MPPLFFYISCSVNTTVFLFFRLGSILKTMLRVIAVILLATIPLLVNSYNPSGNLENNSGTTETPRPIPIE